MSILPSANRPVRTLRPVLQRNLLIVEDDELIGSSLKRAVEAAGYCAAWVTSLASAREAVAEQRPDLMIVDRALPDGDGISLCEEQYDQVPRLPIVMLTARSSELEIVDGLNSGAVDYVVKPFRLAELLARIASHLRLVEQSADEANVARSPSSAPLRVGDLAIDPGGRHAWLDGLEVVLRPKEFELLLRLAQQPGTVIRREQLMADVWDEHWWGSTKTLDVHITALRRRLGEVSADGSRITAIRGVGYRLEV